MTQPNDNVMSLEDPLGDYYWWTLSGTYLDIATDLVAEAPVIGPYSTLDTYLPEVYYKLVVSLIPVSETRSAPYLACIPFIPWFTSPNKPVSSPKVIKFGYFLKRESKF